MCTVYERTTESWCSLALKKITWKTVFSIRGRLFCLELVKTNTWKVLVVFDIVPGGVLFLCYWCLCTYGFINNCKCVQ